MRSRFVSVAGACALAMMWGGPASAASSSANPSADAFVSAAQPNNNYGLGGALEVSPPPAANGEYQTLMKFDLSAMKSSFDSTFGVGQWNVQSVSLQLTSASPGNPIFKANAVGQFAVSWMQNDSWVEGTGSPGGSPVSDGVTFNTLPTFLSAGDQSVGTFASPGTNSGNNTYSLELASGLVSDIAGGSLASLRLLVADNTASYLFNSKNFGTPASRPVLTVVAVPEPSSIIAIGGVAMLFLARRGSREC